MLNANGPGFAGLYAGDVVEFRVRGWEHTHTAAVLPLLVFDTHVVVRFGHCGLAVDSLNFVRRVRRGKRAMAAQRAQLQGWGVPCSR